MKKMIANEEITNILRGGGPLVMHPHDLGRLKEAGESGNKPLIFKGVNIWKDKTGLIEEGQVKAVCTAKGIEVSFSFKETFAA